MAGLTYLLCAITALLCSALLLKGHRRNGYPLLFWSGLAFVGLTLSNFLLVIDKLWFPEVDLSLFRHGATLIAMMLMLYGLVWDIE